MTTAVQRIHLHRIYLDLDNPRHKPQPSEYDAIQNLLAKEDIRPLAKHIAESGRTSPLELMALVPHHKIANGFTTAEGNRRLCALKLLEDPDKAAKDVDRRYFRKLQQDIGRVIRDVDAVVFPTMDAARPWVELRHEGSQGGIGTKPWNSQQKTRFNAQGKGGNPNARALAVMDYARERCLLSTDELDELTLTTLTRFLSTPDVRSALGLTDSKSVEITVPTNEFERALKKFLRDSIEPGTPVNSRADAGTRKTYAESLRSSGIAPATRGLPPATPGNAANALRPARAQKSAATARDNRHPDKRKYVIPPNFGVRIKDKNLKHIYDELKGLDAADFSFCAVYLLRTVLERSTVLYLKGKGITPKRDLHEKLGQLVDQLAREGMSDRELKFLRTVAKNSKDDPHSPDSLGHYIHGGAIPQKSYAIRYWDNLESVMQRILTAV